MKAFFGVIARAIGKIWDFASRIVSLAVIAVLVIAVLTIFMPDNVLQAIEIFKGLIP
jgi:predicted MFS family arabinose efflux permease